MTSLNKETLLGYCPISKTDLNFVKELDEFTLYKVEVALNQNNPIHIAFLFTGFKEGGYCDIYNNTYDYPIRLREVYYLKIIEKLTSCK